MRNANAVREVLAGRGGGVRDAVLVNAAAAIAAHDGLSGRPLDDALGDGLAVATEAVDSGAAAACSSAGWPPAVRARPAP